MARRVVRLSETGTGHMQRGDFTHMKMVKSHALRIYEIQHLAQPVYEKRFIVRSGGGKRALDPGGHSFPLHNDGGQSFGRRLEQFSRRAPVGPKADIGGVFQNLKHFYNS